MNNNENNKNDESSESTEVGFEDIISNEEIDLLESFDVGPRIFVLNNASGTTLLGVVLVETKDSFLVGLPSRMLDVGGSYVIEPFISAPYTRILKSSVTSVSYLVGVFEEPFLAYIEENFDKALPNYVDVLDLSPRTPSLEDILSDKGGAARQPTRVLYSSAGISKVPAPQLPPDTGKVTVTDQVTKEAVSLDESDLFESTLPLTPEEIKARLSSLNVGGKS